MKCRVCGKTTKKYVVCYKHKNTKYKYKCKIHGVTTFIGNQCQKCKQLKKPIYEIVNGKDRKGKKIDKNHYLYPYLNRLTHKTRQYQNRYIKRISKTSGIYGIFVNNICLYVGQSVNITNRVKQHKENFKVAKYHINGMKAHKKRINIGKMKHKVEYKYYEMAYKYNLHDLTFKTLFIVPNTEKEFKEIITYAEQAMIDTYKPKFNHIAARPTSGLPNNLKAVGFH